MKSVTLTLVKLFQDWQRNLPYVCSEQKKPQRVSPTIKLPSQSCIKELHYSLFVHKFQYTSEDCCGIGRVLDRGQSQICRRQ